MAKLPKFTLTHNEKKDRWDLTKDGASRPTASFGTKSDATKGGTLEKAVGKDGGSVKIQKVDGLGAILVEIELVMARVDAADVVAARNDCSVRLPAVGRGRSEAHSGSGHDDAAPARMSVL